MSLLKRMVLAIGQVLGITPPATPVRQIQDGPTGGNNNIVGQPSSVSKESKRKRSNAKVAILAPSPKTETLCVPTRTKKSSEAGTQSVTLARQPAKPKRKPAAKAAQRTTQVKSRKPVQKAAPVERGATGKQSKPTASKTRQRAK